MATRTQRTNDKANELRRLARARWPDAQVSELPQAPTAKQRATASERRAVVVARIREIDQRIAAADGHYSRLLKIARAYMDVDGRENFSAAMTNAVDESELVESLVAERSGLRKERDTLNCHGRRWRVGVILRGPIDMFELKAEADTIDELIALVAAIPPVRG